jgi:exosome complex component RRP45
VSTVGQETKIHTLLEHDPVPLTVHHRPVSVTFALFALAGVKHLVDPTRKEQAVCNGTVSISINAHREVCGLQKFGGVAIQTDKVQYR